LGDVVEGIVFLALAGGLVWLALAFRRHGDKTWWGYLITLPIVLYLAISALVGHPVGGHVGR
jgi:hypothetical protein